MRTQLGQSQIESFNCTAPASSLVISLIAVNPQNQPTPAPSFNFQNPCSVRFKTHNAALLASSERDSRLPLAINTSIKTLHTHTQCSRTSSELATRHSSFFLPFAVSSRNKRRRATTSLRKCSKSHTTTHHQHQHKYTQKLRYIPSPAGPSQRPPEKAFTILASNELPLLAPNQSTLDHHHHHHNHNVRVIYLSLSLSRVRLGPKTKVVQLVKHDKQTTGLFSST